MRALTVFLTAAVAISAGYAARQAGLTDALWASDSDTPILADDKNGTAGNIVPDDDTTGQVHSVRAQLLAQDRIPPNDRSQPASAPKSSPVVDETALRYFAIKGDTKRLQAEIARLKALYPDWTPPSDPLSVQTAADSELDRMWKLYADGKFSELRQAIATRKNNQPDWIPPADLLDRLGTAEAREQLVNASNLKQYDTVLRVASSTPGLLTCADVDVLWRVAEAFATTKKQDRARDAYNYVLANCPDPSQRLATIQKALPLLSRENLDTLLAQERIGLNGVGEFASIRADLARKSVAAGGSDPKVNVDPGDLATVEKLAQEKGLPSDELLLGWYNLRRNNAKVAEEWFRKARASENTAEASQGLALALIAQARFAEAEDILYEWKDASEDVRSVYLAATANLLAIEPPVPIAPDVLQRIVAVAYAARDAATAQQLGWYALALNQFQTASQWFSTALSWKPGDEPSAYGLVLTRNRVRDHAGVAEIQRSWRGRSERIASLGEQSPDKAPEAPKHPAPDVYAPLQAAPSKQAEFPAAAPQMVTSPRQTVPAGAPDFVSAPQARAQHEVASPEASYVIGPQGSQPAAGGRQNAGVKTRSGSPGGCTSSVTPESLSPQAALDRGWCLMNMNRPLEAVPAFEVALRSRLAKTRQDAAYGQSLAYLRAGLSREAAVAATKAPQNRSRNAELHTALLANQATDFFEAGRYVEALIAMDELARITPARIDLMTLRGYAYFKLGRLGDARRVFEAVAATGSREGAKGLAMILSLSDP